MGRQYGQGKALTAQNVRFGVGGRLATAFAICVACMGCDGQPVDDIGESSARNLKVTVSRSVDHLGPGDTVEVTLVAENVGRHGYLKTIEVLIPLSRSLQTVSWTGDLGQRQTIEGAPTNLSVWTLQSLAPGEKATHHIRLQAKAGEDYVAYNGALAFAQNEDGSLLDNGSISTLSVSAGRSPPVPVDLRLRAAGPGNPIRGGEEFAVRMIIDNLTPDEAAHDVVLLGLLDPRVEFARAKSDSDTQYPTKRTFSWQMKTIPGAGQAWMEMRLRAHEGMDLTGTEAFFTSAFLTSREGDPNLSDNWILLGSQLAKP